MLKYFVAIIIFILIFIVNILKNRISPKKLFTLRLVFIVLFLEITIFNINSYRTDFGNLKHIKFDKENIDNITTITMENTQYIVIENINSEVKSIFLELDNLKENQVIDYDIFYSDESTSLRYLATKSYCQNMEKTKYSCISLSRRL